ncbi:MAG: hypothetical protein KQJ78_19760 [Deltaproteobacteria bacterium]|nr:hypothetical protein [Deltaproteobacteria bacterium]
MPPSFAIFGKSLVLAGVLALGLAAAAQAQQTTELVSQSTLGAPGDQACSYSAISTDGRYVAFDSRATNLVAGDTNGASDVFVHDRQTGETTRVSVDSAGNQALDNSGSPSISGDGRYVAFGSAASNLVAGDTNGASDIFVHDRQTGETTRVSVDSASNQALDNSGSPSISGDGRYVAFGSAASNLVAGDTNGNQDVFVHDRQTGETTRVSVDSAGNQGNGLSRAPAISADGRWVAFPSEASNLVAGDTNGNQDVFLHDRQTGATTRVSLSTNGDQPDNTCQSPVISSDGGYVAFESTASNLVAGDTNGLWDIFVRDVAAGATTRVSVSTNGDQSDNSCMFSTISGDGRLVAFHSQATNLVAGDTNGVYDVFLHDRQTGVTTLESRSTAGVQGDASSGRPVLSGDGSMLNFGSSAQNFVTVPPNVWNIFVRGPYSTNVDLLMYRAYNPYVMSHFYTTRQNEFQAAVAAGLVDESTGHPGQLFRVFQDAAPGLNRPIHRLYDPYSGQHYYTRRDQERDALVAAGWVFERDEGYVYLDQATAPANCVEVLVLYNSVAGCHLYTINAAEAAYVATNIPDWAAQPSLGWALRNTPPVAREAAGDVDPDSSVISAAWSLSCGQ